MKKTIKLFGIIALVAAIGFSMTACDWLFDDGSPEITTSSLPDGTVGTAYSQTLAAKGEKPITWSIASGSLPTGLSLVAGTITGMPATAGTSTFTVKAENDNGSDTKQLSITIATPLLGTVTITGTARVGQTLTANITLLLGEGTVSYQWKRGDTATADGTDISGATSGTYKLVEADQGKYITVTVSRTGYSGSKTSTATAAVAAFVPSAWTAVANTTFGEGYESRINDVAWGGGTANRFVAVGAEGKMAYSSNGETWTAVPNSGFSTGGSINAIAWGNNKFVAGGYESGAKIATSTDGITWTGAAATDSFSGSIWAIAWGDNKFVAGDGWGKIAYSSDGLSWTAVADSTFTTSDDVNAITYGGGKFVAVANNGKMAYSSNGITWTAVTDSKITGSIKGIAWGGGKFVAVGGDSAQMASSTDGITWTAITNHTFPSTVVGSRSAAIGAIVWGGNKFVAGGMYIDLVAAEAGNRTAYSADGVTWTAGAGQMFSEALTSPKAIAWSGNKFVAVGGDGIFADGQISYSTTGQ